MPSVGHIIPNQLSRLLDPKNHIKPWATGKPHPTNHFKPRAIGNRVQNAEMISHLLLLIGTIFSARWENWTFLTSLTPKMNMIFRNTSAMLNFYNVHEVTQQRLDRFSSLDRPLEKYNPEWLVTSKIASEQRPPYLVHHQWSSYEFTDQFPPKLTDKTSLVTFTWWLG